jgi:hypothetical protein
VLLSGREITRDTECASTVQNWQRIFRLKSLQVTSNIKNPTYQASIVSDSANDSALHYLFSHINKIALCIKVVPLQRQLGKMVAGVKGISSRSTVVKGISVQLLDLIAHRDKVSILCGDIGIADCLEKIYSRAGPEFEDCEGSIMVFNKALYGLRSSSRGFWGLSSFHGFLCLSLRSRRMDARMRGGRRVQLHLYSCV